MQPRLKQSARLFLLFIVSFGLIGAASGAETAVSAQNITDRDYKFMVAVNANGFARSEKVVSLFVDFEAELDERGAIGTFDLDSVRVAEVTSSGAMLNDSVPFQFDNGTGLQEEEGTLLILLDGNTAANETRYYEVYFDTTGAFSQPTIPDFVFMVDDEQGYRGQQSYRIETYDGDGTTRNAQYYYHKRGGGFASIYDRTDTDWISYYQDAGSESKGEFRGIPNLGEVFHPGYNNASGGNLRSTTTLISDGPLRIVFESTSIDGEWTARWEIFPTYAQMTILDIPDGDNYWFLYEGTPGGNLEFSGAEQDVVVRSDGEPNINAGDSWAEEDQELGSAPEATGEWAYFNDSATDRLFFVAHDQDDSQPDSYRHQFNNNATDPTQADDEDGGAMTVMGFGRKTTTGVTRHLTALNAVFTIGFGESQDPADAKSTIFNATQDVIVSKENVAPTVEQNNTTVLDEGGTAVFSNTTLFATDPDGDDVSYIVTALPSNGTLLLNDAPLAVNDSFTQVNITNGDVSYTHDGSETSSDSFSVSATDGIDTADAVTLSLTIVGVNDAPTANTDDVYVVSGESVIIMVLSNDTDPENNNLSVIDLTDPMHGSVTLNPDNTITYLANKNFEGTDSFTYKVTDGDKESAATTVNLTIGGQLYIYLPRILR